MTYEQTTKALDAWADWFVEHNKLSAGTPEWEESAKRRPALPGETPRSTFFEGPGVPDRSVEGL